MRLLQVIPDTSDTSGNLAALRHHELLARDGVEVRTLALGPGPGRVVTPLVPAMAPSARSLAASAQLRRELRWPDLAIAVGHLPKAMVRRSQVPVVVVAATGTTRARLVDRAAGSPVVCTVVVPSGDPTPDGPDSVASRSHIRTPHAAGFASSLRTDASRRAARSRLGVADDAVVVMEIDPLRGVTVAVRAVGPSYVEEVDLGSLGVTGRRSHDPATDAEAIEVLAHAADAISPSRVPYCDPPDALAPLLVDMMAVGVVPVGWPTRLDAELLVGGETALGDPDAHLETGRGSSDPPGVATDLLRSFGSDPSMVHRLSRNAADVAARLCGPDGIRDEWSAIIDQALPSQT